MSKPLQINDLFWTLQGEGRWTGHRALFIRLPYCNYDCPWCDTEYNSYKEWSEEDFKIFANKEQARFAVITGGEPLAHKDLPRIINLLKDLKFYIACETNGSLTAHDDIDFVTVSPKAFTKKKFDPFYIEPSLLTKAGEFKYVVDKDFDFSILDKHIPAQPGIEYSLSPEYGDMENNIPKIMGYIQKHPTWKLSLQTHKWINIP